MKLHRYTTANRDLAKAKHTIHTREKKKSQTRPSPSRFEIYGRRSSGRGGGDKGEKGGAAGSKKEKFKYAQSIGRHSCGLLIFSQFLSLSLSLEPCVFLGLFFVPLLLGEILEFSLLPRARALPNVGCSRLLA